MTLWNESNDAPPSQLVAPPPEDSFGPDGGHADTSFPDASAESTIAVRANDPLVHVYLDAARSASTFCLTQLEPFLPWRTDGWGRKAHISPNQLASMLESSLTLAVQYEQDRGVQQNAYAREAVRQTLMAWQHGLNRDGIPLRWRSRRDTNHVRATYHILLLLNETSGFDGSLLYDDLRKHVSWLAARPMGPPLIEAQLSCLLADTAILIGDASLHEQARLRLKNLLQRQSAEGWFWVRDGLNLGIQSRLIDPLARLYRVHERSDLREPLDRLLRFLAHFVLPNGQFGGCFQPGGPVVLAPYGVEVLAETSSNASLLASTARNQWSSASQHGDHFAIRSPLVASASLAATLRQNEIFDNVHWPHQEYGHTAFNEAGWIIRSTPSYYAVVNPLAGGAIHVTWRNQEPDVVDAGVQAIFALRAMSSAAPGSARTWSLEGDRVQVKGVLSHKSVGKQLGHDKYRRSVTFGSRWVCITDQVDCRLRCRSVICQTPLKGLPVQDGAEPTVASSQRAPIVVDGGRHVCIRRIYQDGVLLDPDAPLPGD